MHAPTFGLRRESGGGCWMNRATKQICSVLLLVPIHLHHPLLWSPEDHGAVARQLIGERVDNATDSRNGEAVSVAGTIPTFDERHEIVMAPRTEGREVGHREGDLLRPVRHFHAHAVEA